jgi:hypothetical protein
MGDRYDKYVRIHPALGFALIQYIDAISQLQRRGDIILRHDSSDDSWWVRGTWENNAGWMRLHA